LQRRLGFGELAAALVSRGGLHELIDGVLAHGCGFYAGRDKLQRGG
jgi:hypothetical protein